MPRSLAQIEQSATPEPFYDDGQITLYCGDSLALMGSVGHVACIVTDPPYGDTSLAWDRTPDPAWLAAAALVTPTLWCFGSLRFWLSESGYFEAEGWRYAQEIVWQKTFGSGPNSDRFTRVHELAVQWYRGPWKDLHHDVPRSQWNGPDRKIRKGLVTTPHRGQYAQGRDPWLDDGTRMMHSVIEVRSEFRRAVHPTQKPLGILRPLIQYSCPAGGVVLDPFAGSGSTLVAALATLDVERSGSRLARITARPPSDDSHRGCSMPRDRIEPLVHQNDRVSGMGDVERAKSQVIKVCPVDGRATNGPICREHARWAVDLEVVPASGSLHGLLQTIRGMCTDECPHVEVDKKLADAVEQAKRLEEANDYLRSFEDRGDWCIYRAEYEALIRSRERAAEIVDAAEAQGVYSRAEGAQDRWVRVALPVRLLDQLAAEVS